jgi:hypothetical protein
MAWAASSPTKTVQLFLEAHRQGRFAEARSFALERANMHASLFSSWLFAGSPGQQAAGTADIFLSRKFVDLFRYSIQGTTPGGDNHTYVNVLRTSPSIMHMYTWAIAPRRGATPYALIEAVDAYLTKVNFPVEESRMRFTLIREADEWYISAVEDEKFAVLQQQMLAQAAPPAGASEAVAAAPQGEPTAAPGATTTSEDRGRLLSDAQFNATLRSFNAATPPAASVEAAPPQPKEKEPFLSRLFGFGKKQGTTLAYLKDKRLDDTFDTIRDALARYSVAGDAFPGTAEIYDWQSLRHLVNRYRKNALPETEEEAGFRFLSYKVYESGQDYILLVELKNPQNGIARVEVNPLSVDRAK